jgi:hypothetical protein
MVNVLLIKYKIKLVSALFSGFKKLFAILALMLYGEKVIGVFNKE